MENNIQIFESEQFGAIRINVLEGNEIEINLEDAARGLGFTTEQTIDGKTYSNIRWNRVREYLKEIGFLPEVAKNGYIPEPVFYMLAMKANNEAARKFQRWIAFEVVPSVRKRGGYISAKSEITPEFLRNLADALEAEIRKVAALEGKVTELTTKASYYDTVLNCRELLSTTDIAKDYGFSATKFNQLLNRLGIQFRHGNKWILYQKYAKLGWTATKTQALNGTDGMIHAKQHRYWTQVGRRGLYDLLKRHGYYPTAEQPTLLA